MCPTSSDVIRCTSYTIRYSLSTPTEPSGDFATRYLVLSDEFRHIHAENRHRQNLGSSTFGPWASRGHRRPCSSAGTSPSSHQFPQIAKACGPCNLRSFRTEIVGLVDRHVDLGDAPGQANGTDKLLTLVASALAGGDCIDDADALRAGGTEQVLGLGCAVKAPSTLGTFLRSFRWGHARQLGRVSREVLARAWGAGASPSEEPLTIDLDATVCETYGLAKEGAQRHNYAGQRGYHPLLAVAAGTGPLMAD